MLAFAALTPHSPLLTETVGRDVRDRMRRVIEAMGLLADGLASEELDTLVILSEHGHHEDAFCANLMDRYVTDLSRFGDYGTRLEFRSDPPFIDRLQRAARKAGLPFTLNSDPGLDHGHAVPLILLTERPSRLRLVPISVPSAAEPEQLAAFGTLLRDLIEDSPNRIGIVASGDLSHCRSEEAPLGLKPEGEAFDEAVVRAVRKISAKELLRLDASLSEEASECVSRPLLALLSTFDGLNADVEILANDAPMGVGFLVARFHL